MELEAKFDKIEEHTKCITRKNKSTGLKEDDKETWYTATFAIKKIGYDKDENIKQGTSDPWTRLVINTMDKEVLKEFENAKMGDKVLITVDKV